MGGYLQAGFAAHSCGKQERYEMRSGHMFDLRMCVQGMYGVIDPLVLYSLHFNTRCSLGPHSDQVTHDSHAKPSSNIPSNQSSSTHYPPSLPCNRHFPRIPPGLDHIAIGKGLHCTIQATFCTFLYLIFASDFCCPFHTFPFNL